MPGRTISNIRAAIRRRPVYQELQLLGGPPAAFALDSRGRTSIAVPWVRDNELRRGDTVVIALDDAITLAAEAGVPVATAMQELATARDEERYLQQQENELLRMEMKRTHDQALTITKQDAEIRRLEQRAEDRTAELRQAQAANKRKRRALRELLAAYEHRVDDTEAAHAGEARAFALRNEHVQSAIDGAIMGISVKLVQMATAGAQDNGPLFDYAVELQQNVRTRQREHQHTTTVEAARVMRAAGLTSNQVAKAFAQAGRHLEREAKRMVPRVNPGGLGSHMRQAIEDTARVLNPTAEQHASMRAAAQRLGNGDAITAEAARQFEHADHDADTVDHG